MNNWFQSLKSKTKQINKHKTKKKIKPQNKKKMSKDHKKLNPQYNNYNLQLLKAGLIKSLQKCMMIS